MIRVVWKEPPAHLDVKDEVVHVWRAALDQPSPVVERLANTLSAQEQLRVERFHREQDRRRYIVARGVLRTILGRYRDCAAGALQFDYGPQGKPFLTDTHVPNPISFNLAHSQDLALCAIARVPVGVDLERIQPVPEMDQIVQRFFPIDEREVYLHLAPETRTAFFFNTWTRIEAVRKGTGEGLGDIGHSRKDSVRLDEGRYAGWHVETFAPAPHYAACVAISAPTMPLIGWDFLVEESKIEYALDSHAGWRKGEEYV